MMKLNRSSGLERTHVKVFADLLLRYASLRSTCICWKARGRRFVTCCKPWILANRKDDSTTDARRWGPLWEQVFWAISWNVNSSKNTRVSEWFRWAHDMNSTIRYNNINPNLPLRMTYSVYMPPHIYSILAFHAGRVLYPKWVFLSYKMCCPCPKTSI